MVLDGATATVDDISVRAMTGIGRVMDVSGTGTSATVREAKVLDNLLTGIGQNWIGFRVLDAASLTITKAIARGNVGSEALFWALRGAQLTMERVDVIGSVGALAIVSAFLSFF